MLWTEVPQAWRTTAFDAFAGHGGRLLGVLQRFGITRLMDRYLCANLHGA